MTALTGGVRGRSGHKGGEGIISLVGRQATALSWLTHHPSCAIHSTMVFLRYLAYNILL